MHLHTRSDRSAGTSRREKMSRMASILVIDDDEVLRKTIRVVLEVAGYDVIGLAALRTCAGRLTAQREVNSRLGTRG
jgi:DNA-binding NtrC family response regulator